MSHRSACRAVPTRPRRTPRASRRPGHPRRRRGSSRRRTPGQPQRCPSRPCTGCRGSWFPGPGRCVRSSAEHLAQYLPVRVDLQRRPVLLLEDREEGPDAQPEAAGEDRPDQVRCVVRLRPANDDGVGVGLGFDAAAGTDFLSDGHRQGLPSGVDGLLGQLRLPLGQGHGGIAHLAAAGASRTWTISIPAMTAVGPPTTRVPTTPPIPAPVTPPVKQPTGTKMTVTPVTMPPTAQPRTKPSPAPIRLPAVVATPTFADQAPMASVFSA